MIIKFNKLLTYLFILTIIEYMFCITKYVQIICCFLFEKINK